MYVPLFEYEYIYLKERKRTKYTLDAKPDRISWLTGHVTDQILSYLPIRDAVRKVFCRAIGRKNGTQFQILYLIQNVCLLQLPKILQLVSESL